MLTWIAAIAEEGNDGQASIGKGEFVRGGSLLADFEYRFDIFVGWRLLAASRLGIRRLGHCEKAEVA